MTSALRRRPDAVTIIAIYYFLCAAVSLLVVAMVGTIGMALLFTMFGDAELIAGLLVLAFRLYGRHRRCGKRRDGLGTADPEELGALGGHRAGHLSPAQLPHRHRYRCVDYLLPGAR